MQIRSNSKVRVILGEPLRTSRKIAEFVPEHTGSNADKNKAVVAVIPRRHSVRTADNDAKHKK